MKIVHTFVDTLKARKSEIAFFYQKIKEENQWSKRSVYFALLWQNLLFAVIILFPVVMVPILILLNLFLDDIKVSLKLFGALISLLCLFLFELWILFILRKVYPKTKENLLKKLEGKS
ncbi:BH2517 [Halalkalibacterium halodurans C-125]|uniref:BH2517 protein n=1 Tax=Halalkalibacterium halodurans (strain ATCC BAA-125 / DSM 18197 / FERM 7344 / JCM 9153 / C-125) TaxID=272558 RepID=Q9K9X7_HALH5|nr:BH2517 [Halalkalibacterium halodurans C-125]